MKQLCLLLTIILSFNAHSLVFLKNMKWRTGQTINFIFTHDEDGEPIPLARQLFIENYAREWLRYANLKFNFIDGSKLTFAELNQRESDPKNNVIINFQEMSGASQSAQETLKGDVVFNLNFDSKPNNEKKFTNDDLTSRFIIHEFGHILGLMHEHQHPQRQFSFKGNIFCEDQGWSSNHCDHNINNVLSGYKFSRTKYDRKSVMHYDFGTRYITGNAIQTNNYISFGDAKGIQQLYPHDGMTISKLQKRWARAKKIHDRKIKFRQWANGAYSGGYSEIDGKFVRHGHGHTIEEDEDYKGEFQNNERDGYGIHIEYNVRDGKKEVAYITEGYWFQHRLLGCNYMEWGEAYKSKQGQRFFGYIYIDPDASSWTPYGDSGYGMYLKPKGWTTDNGKVDKIYIGEFERDIRFPNGCGYTQWFGSSLWQGYWKGGVHKEQMSHKCNASKFAEAKKQIQACMTEMPRSKYFDQSFDEFIKIDKGLFKNF